MAKRLTLRERIRRELEAHNRALRQGTPTDDATGDTLAKIMLYIEKEPHTVTLNVGGGIVHDIMSTHKATTINLIDSDDFDGKKRDRQGRTKDEAEAQWNKAAKEHHHVF